MSVSIVVPFLSDGAERDRNWAYVRARYEEQFPDWQIVVGTCEEPWRKGIAVHDAVERADGDVLIISDADVVISAHALTDAVSRLETSPWVVPHRIVYRLTEEATQAVIEDRLVLKPRNLDRSKLERTGGSARGGGIVVLKREDYEKAGGIDSRFEGWGGEDIAFSYALDTLIGRHVRFGQALWHLYHEPQERRPGRRGSEQTEALANRYLAVRGDPVGMKELVEETHPGMVGGGIVVARREAVEAAPLDPRFVGWGQEDEAFGMALTALAGPPRRGVDDLIHLHHRLPERNSRARGNRAGWELRWRYVRARRRPDQMFQLAQEARESLHASQHALHADS